jgi:hypothetical protein
MGSEEWVNQHLQGQFIVSLQINLNVYVFFIMLEKTQLNMVYIISRRSSFPKQLGFDVNLRDVSEGIPIIKERLHQKKVLLVSYQVAFS